MKMKNIIKILLIVVLIGEIVNIYVYNKSISFNSNDIALEIEKLNPDSYSSHKTFYEVELLNIKRDMKIYQYNIDKSLHIINILMITSLITLLGLFIVSCSKYSKT